MLKNKIVRAIKKADFGGIVRAASPKEIPHSISHPIPHQRHIGVPMWREYPGGLDGYH